MNGHERIRVRTAFDRYARSPRKQRAWSAANVGNRAIRDELAERAVTLAGPPLQNGEILDIGCGSGWWLEKLAAAGIPATRLHGIDILQDRVAAARRLEGASISVADARVLPFGDASVAVATLFLVLSSLEDETAMRGALAEARRVTRPRGRVLVWEPRVPNPGNRGTVYVRSSMLADVLGPPSATVTLTVFPPLARRLGSCAAYRRLAAISMLRTHRLTVHAIP